MPDEMKTPDRLAAIDAAIAAADKVVETLAEMANSGDLRTARDADEQLIEAHNRIDDLRAIRALLRHDGELQPLSQEDAAKLDALGRQLDEDTRTSALANAGLEFLAKAIETATEVGQIVSERPRVLSATSSPPGTSTQSV